MEFGKTVGSMGNATGLEGNDIQLAPVPDAGQLATRALKEKVAVVTGAASGIGKAVALTLARAGAAVGVVDMNLEGANLVAAEIIASGGLALAIAMDVSDEAAVDTGIDAIAAAFGTVDILIANAGIQIIGSIDTLSFADWKKVLSIHLDGSFLTTKAALRHMYERNRGGTVIYMGSAHSHVASPLKSAYVTAKHGLLGLARTLAKEGAKHGVRANVVCPGFVRTPLVDKQIPEQAAALGLSEEAVVRDVILSGTVDQTFTTLNDVAQTVLFLTSFPTAALTGQSIMVSHGWYMQ